MAFGVCRRTLRCVPIRGAASAECGLMGQGRACLGSWVVVGGMRPASRSDWKAVRTLVSDPPGRDRGFGDGDGSAQKSTSALVHDCRHLLVAAVELSFRPSELGLARSRGHGGRIWKQ